MIELNALLNLKIGVRLGLAFGCVILLLLARFGVKAVIPGFRGFSLGMMWTFGAAVTCCRR